MSRYLTFSRVPNGMGDLAPQRKTAVVAVDSRSSGATLGWIKWFGRWRQYAFFPEPGTVFNPECMDDINSVIRSLMNERTADRIKRWTA